MLNQTSLISIIIPVYRAEQYLQQCFDSVLNQTYKNLEIILVDDGSPGGSPRICDDYAAKDSRIKVIHKSNGGLADARNAGLDTATGEYITHVDCDDWIANDMIEFLYNNIIEHDADIALCGEYRAYIGLTVPYITKCFDNLHILTGEQAAERMLTIEERPSAYAKLYKRTVFDNIRYPAGAMYEDAFVIIDVLMAAKKVVLNPEPKYYYRQRKSSILHANAYIEKVAPKINELEKRRDNIGRNYPGIAQMSEANLCKRYIRIVRALLSEGDYSKTPEGHETISSILNKIKEKSKQLLNNPYLRKEERIILKIMRINASSDKMVLLYLKLQRKVKKRMLRSQKKPDNAKVLFD